MTNTYFIVMLVLAGFGGLCLLILIVLSILVVKYYRFVSTFSIKNLHFNIFYSFRRMNKYRQRNQPLRYRPSNVVYTVENGPRSQNGYLNQDPPSRTSTYEYSRPHRPTPPSPPSEASEPERRDYREYPSERPEYSYKRPSRKQQREPSLDSRSSSEETDETGEARYSRTRRPGGGPKPKDPPPYDASAVRRPTTYV